jgi:6-phosphogluconate dehydrogenase
MQIGILGMGRMGANMARRLQAGGVDCVLWDRTPDKARGLADEIGATAVADLDELAASLAPPRAAWTMVPAGEATDDLLEGLRARFETGDCLIDGSNGHYRDDIRRAAELGQEGIEYLDVGVSGGVWGVERGYCLMIGGPGPAVRALDPVFRALAPGVEAAGRTPGRDGEPANAEQGYLHCGAAGAGHYVKMVHNGIEYGLMQAYAEGFHLLSGAGGEELPPAERYDLDTAAIAEVWRRGSVIGSWLLDLSAAALHEDPALDGFEGRVPDSGEGRWTVQTAVERGVPAEVLSSALYARFRSRETPHYGDRLLSALRRQFGGHGEGR